jgi:hypothetical protein
MAQGSICGDGTVSSRTAAASIWELYVVARRSLAHSIHGVAADFAAGGRRRGVGRTSEWTPAHCVPPRNRINVQCQQAPCNTDTTFSREMYFTSIHCPFYLSIYLYIYLSVCISIYLSIYLSICISIHPSVHPSIHSSIHIFIYFSLFLLMPIFLFASCFNKILHSKKQTHKEEAYWHGDG